MAEDGWERLANDPSATVIVERMGHHLRLDSGVVNDIIGKVDEAIAAGRPDEPLYVRCDRIYNDWRPRPRGASMLLARIDDLRLYSNIRYHFGMPREMHPGYPPVRGLYWLVRKRLVETTPTTLALRPDPITWQGEPRPRQ